MAKKILFIAAALLGICNAFAEVKWDGTSSTAWTEGDGTEASPYVLSTPAHLKYLQEQVNAGTSYAGVYFKQTEDFNLNNKAWNQIGFQQIGSSGESGIKYFEGNYDGNGKYISNLKNILFGYIKNSEIKNLTLQGNDLNMQSLAVFGVNSVDGASSLVKTTAGACRIINCHNRINITSYTNSCGGLVTTAGGTSLEMISCTNTGTFGCYFNSGTGYTLNFGGLIATSNVENLQLTSCGNKGNFSFSRADSQQAANLYVGGLVGKISSGNVTINQCYSNAALTPSIPQYVSYKGAGHMVGYMESGTSVTISRSFGRGAATGFSVGASSSNISIEGCYVRGGGLFGGATITSCYYVGYTGDGTYSWPININYCFHHITSGTNLQRGTTVSERELKSTAFLPRINIDEEYFTMDYEGINDGYPILKWQAGTRYNISATCDANRGSVTGGGEYPNGYAATLTATPKSGCTFVGWSDGNTDNPRTVTVSGEASYIAQFAKSSYIIYVNQDCTGNIE